MPDKEKLYALLFPLGWLHALKLGGAETPFLGLVPDRALANPAPWFSFGRAARAQIGWRRAALFWASCLPGHWKAIRPGFPLAGLHALKLGGVETPFLGLVPVRTWKKLNTLLILFSVF